VSKRKKIAKKIDVDYLAQLGNLTLSKKEKSLYEKQLGKAVKYIKILKEIKTRGVEPVAQVTRLENVFFPDQVDKSLTQKQALSNASKQRKGYFVTQRIKWE